MKVVRCEGEGQGSCRRCEAYGRWNRTWMTLLFRIEGMKGCYCSKCVEELRAIEDELNKPSRDIIGEMF